LTALNPPPPPVRPDERLDQCLIAPRLRRRQRAPSGIMISFQPPRRCSRCRYSRQGNSSLRR
jgi:hypothetical protein